MNRQPYSPIIPAKDNLNAEIKIIGKTIAYFQTMEYNYHKNMPPHPPVVFFLWTARGFSYAKQ